jgi:hypothetical protein
MRVVIEPPDGWGSARALKSELQRLGYELQEHIILGRRLFVLDAGSADTDQPASRRRRRANDLQ